MFHKEILSNQIHSQERSCNHFYNQQNLFYSYKYHTHYELVSNVLLASASYWLSDRLFWISLIVLEFFD